MTADLFANKGFYLCVAFALVFTIPALAAVLGYFWHRVRQAEINASLIHDMLERGLAPEQIRGVLNAGPRSGLEELLASRSTPPPPRAVEPPPAARPAVDPPADKSGWRLRCLKCNKMRWLGPLGIRWGCNATKLAWCTRCQRPRWAALETASAAYAN
jgi:hypothetical protein